MQYPTKGDTPYNYFSSSVPGSPILYEYSLRLQCLIAFIKIGEFQNISYLLSVIVGLEKKYCKLSMLNMLFVQN